MSKLPKLGRMSFGSEDGFKLNLDKYVAGDYADIASAAVELPAIMEWLNQALQQLLERKTQTNSEIKQAEARAYFWLKKAGWDERGYSGKPTGEALKYAVELEEEVITLNKEYAELLAAVSRVRGTIDNISLKIDLVRSSESTRRKIFDSSSESGAPDDEEEYAE